MVQFMLILVLLILSLVGSEAACDSGCPLALGSYYISPNLNLTYVSSVFSLPYSSSILPFSPNILNQQFIQVGQRLNVSFPCDCINSEFHARTFTYTTLPSDTYERIARIAYANLTKPEWVASGNSYPPTRIPDGAKINVTVNCSCGDVSVSREYGLFETYPLREGESLGSVAAGFGLAGKEGLLERYNPGVNFSAGSGIVFIPVRGNSCGLPILLSSSSS